MSSEERTLIIDSKDKRKGLAGWSQNLINTALCGMLWELYFEDDTQLCFKRDWKIGTKNVPLRTTWTLGWFILQLHQNGLVDFARRYPAMRTELEAYPVMIQTAPLMEKSPSTLDIQNMKGNAEGRKTANGKVGKSSSWSLFKRVSTFGKLDVKP
eukprot:CAMPEP_0185754998 /NCGR_PEP_ID=MMETSP1174-20130828/13548_1 /TAXON_ID=35687 /ORGANISM="Dictyocha speculum, Strain CCMP1381" /LENGTH=154 /DNA_ID=CAMNT_0028433403 /DNA_START=47 /DNA_END=511 /DNA_ORIENTATION=+